MAISNSTIEKVTFNIPADLKQELVKLKNEMKVSFNTLYKNALTEYIAKSETLSNGKTEIYEY